NSAHVAGRIRRYYNHEATIVYPPVDKVFNHPADIASESHFLIVSALLPHQAGPGVTFLGWQSKEEIRDEYRRTAAVILPGEEDFGIVPVEAQACGRPTGGFVRGGRVETV